jgi:hypothetical protein
MCEEAQMAVNMNVEAAPRMRYNVNATKSDYFSGEFETAEEAIDAAAELVHQGYATVAIRDSSLDKEIW